MAVVINTNVDSIKIRHNLTSSTNNLSTCMQRMSTGLKVLTAKDDAAGTVIAARMQVQLDGNQIAQNNVQNGNAMLTTAEGHLDVVQDNLSRLRDLTLQAKNGTYSQEEIQAMEDEVVALIDEIDRISSSSKYSSLHLFEQDLDAEGNPLATNLQEDGCTFQVGANSSEDNTILADKSLFQSVKFAELTGRDGVTPIYTAKKDGAADLAVTAAGTPDYYKIVSKDVALKEDGSFNTGYAAVFETDADGNATGEPIYIEADKADPAPASSEGYVAVSDAADATKYKKTTTTESTPAPSGLSLTTMTKAEMATAIDDLDKALDNITGRKSIIGAAQNRLESALSTLTTQYENLSSAKSVITDADIAAEASNFTQQQILQQVSTSLLAQANQAPSIALSLV